jgi:hypothetical protein
VKFLHLRNIPAFYREMFNQRLPIRHATIAYVQHASGSVTAAIAITNPKDNFSRKIGRTIAENRLKKGLCETLSMPDVVEKQALLLNLSEWAYKKVHEISRKCDARL